MKHCVVSRRLSLYRESFNILRAVGLDVCPRSLCKDPRIMSVHDVFMSGEK